MGKMIGKTSYWGMCSCRDCATYPEHKRMKRRAKRRERQNWKREVRNEV